MNLCIWKRIWIWKREQENVPHTASFVRHIVANVPALILPITFGCNNFTKIVFEVAEETALVLYSLALLSCWRGLLQIPGAIITIPWRILLFNSFIYCFWNLSPPDSLIGTIFDSYFQNELVRHFLVLILSEWYLLFLQFIK